MTENRGQKIEIRNQRIEGGKMAGIKSCKDLKVYNLAFERSMQIFDEQLEIVLLISDL